MPITTKAWRALLGLVFLSLTQKQNPVEAASWFGCQVGEADGADLNLDRASLNDLLPLTLGSHERDGCLNSDIK